MRSLARSDAGILREAVTSATGSVRQARDAGGVGSTLIETGDQGSFCRQLWGN